MFMFVLSLYLYTRRAGDCGNMFASLRLYLKFQIRGRTVLCGVLCWQSNLLVDEQRRAAVEKETAELWLCVRAPERKSKDRRGSRGLLLTT